MKNKVKCPNGTSRGTCFINGHPCDHAKEHKIIDNCNKKICYPDLYETVKTHCK